MRDIRDVTSTVFAYVDIISTTSVFNGIFFVTVSIFNKDVLVLPAKIHFAQTSS